MVPLIFQKFQRRLKMSKYFKATEEGTGRHVNAINMSFNITINQIG